QQIDYLQRERNAPPKIKGLLAALRAEIRAKNLNFEVAYTTALDRTLAELAGFKQPVNIATRVRLQNSLAGRLKLIDENARANFIKLQKTQLPEMTTLPSPTLASFDWRNLGKVTCVSSQKSCGSCWAFGAVGAYESSYLIRNAKTVDVS